jgi:hypothetical protein
MTYIDELIEVIRKLHGSKATHVETYQSKKHFRVRQFGKLHDHPQADRVYAWSHETDNPDNPRQHITVLHMPPATSPLRAVQVAIAGMFREQEANAES